MRLLGGSPPGYHRGTSRPGRRDRDHDAEAARWKGSAYVSDLGVRGNLRGERICEVVQDRRRGTLVPLIQERVRPRTNVKSDGWGPIAGWTTTKAFRLTPTRP